jgi:hypothetical protein
MATAVQAMTLLWKQRDERDFEACQFQNRNQLIKAPMQVRNVSTAPSVVNAVLKHHRAPPNSIVLLHNRPMTLLRLGTVPKAH